MNIFNRKTKKKHIEQFEMKIIELLESEFPQLRKAIGISKLMHISFMENPKGIFVARGYGPKAFEKINQNHKTSFNLNGISIWNRKTEVFELLKLNYHHDTLTKIEIDNPQHFYKTFDLSLIKKSEIKLEHLKMKNPDQKIAEKALKSLTKEQIGLLELEYTFEIEFDEKLFYAILDMEDGKLYRNGQKRKIYRLNHDHEERVRLIANKPTDFFEIYNGQKSELEQIMYE